MTLREAVEALAAKWERDAEYFAEVARRSTIERARDAAARLRNDHKDRAAALRALLASPEATTGAAARGPCYYVFAAALDHRNVLACDECHRVPSCPSCPETKWTEERGFHYVPRAPALAPSIASLLGPHCTEGDEETLAHTTKACREIDR
jgi:rubrerythrin